MAASLHVVEGPDSGRLFVLTQDQVTIGRNADNTIVLNDTGISGSHTKLMRDERGQFALLDMASTNGTFVNDKEQHAADLRSGDRIQIGSSTLVFTLDGAGPRIAQNTEGVATVTLPREESEERLIVLPELDLTQVSREELEHGYLRVVLMDRLDTALEQLDGPTEVLSCVLDAALAATGAQRGLVLLVDAKTGEIVPSISRNRLGDDEVPFPTALTLQVANEGSGFVGADPREGGEGRPILCASLQSTSSTRGVVLLDSPRTGEFATGDLATVQAMARRAGSCLSAARWRVDFELLFSSTIDAIMNTIQAKDVYTRGHSERVRHYSKLLGKELGLKGEELYRVTLGAALHDIGKVGMPDSVLKNNTTPILTPEQMAEVRRHPVRGAKILKDITFLRDVIPAAELHHEDWNGGGYPHGLQGEEIPLIARIVAVADTYDAITTDRPYQKGKSYEEGHGILRKIAGKRLEPDLVEHFIEAWYRHRKGPTKRRPMKSTRVGLGTLAAQATAAEAPSPAEPAPPVAAGDIDDRLSQIIEIG